VSNGRLPIKQSTIPTAPLASNGQVIAGRFGSAKKSRQLLPNGVMNYTHIQDFLSTPPASAWWTGAAESLALSERT